MSETNTSIPMTPTKEEEEEGPTLLWVPYLSLTIVLLLMTLASFVNYHLKNRGKYENEKVKKEVRDNQQQQVQKYRVTLNLRGALYDKRKSLKSSLDCASTVTTSVDSIAELTPSGQDLSYVPEDPKEELGTRVACYHNPAFRSSEQSLENITQDIFTVQDEKPKGKRVQNGGWRTSSASAAANRNLPLASGSDSRHMERRYTSPHLAGSQSHHDSDSGKV